MSSLELSNQLSVTRARILTQTALCAAYTVHHDLGDLGRQASNTDNRFGEGSLTGDIEIEREMFTNLSAANIRIDVYSEEHGAVESGLTRIGGPAAVEAKVVCIMDGQDGSGNYARSTPAQPLRYGTMFALFSGADPRYDDYLACGIMEHTTNRLFVAERDGGLKVLTLGTETSQWDDGELVTTRRSTELHSHSIGFVNVNSHGWGPNDDDVMRALGVKGCGPYGSTAVHYVDVASGEASFMVEGTRKNNLEHAVGYGFLKEAGGVVLDCDGGDLGQQRYLSYQQDLSVHRPVVAAATPELAREIFQRLPRVS